MTDLSLIPIVSSVLLFVAVLVGLGPLGKLWDMFSELYTRDLLKLLAILEIDEEKFNFYMRIWGIVLVGTLFVMLAVFQLPLLAVALTIIVVAFPRIWMGMMVKRRRTMLREQMAGACMAIANCARAGLSLDQSLQSVADEAVDPLAAVLKRICRDYKANIPLAEAINRAKDRINLDTFSIFAVTIVTCLEHGGQVTEMLDRISKSIGEIRRLERRIESETAAGRRVVWILALFPLFFLTVMALIHSEGTKLMFTTLWGQGLLVGSILLIAISIAWSRNILSVDF
jgi:tight adherence protein B